MGRPLNRAWFALLRVATCISCGAPYGSPHAANCAFRLHGVGGDR